uniref:Transposon protein, putative, unclassified n=1 Tax=Oryza sativa subsp. japonica TaxID=39947 RepID=Q10LY0_ORYSJ|nr:transposon protein, putative, unclassified [Oryza sativa Japonica Group]
MTTEEKMLIRTLKECNIPTRHMIVILSVLRGGLTSLPYTKKDISNVRTTINKETSSNDMMKTLEFFRRKKEKDPHFFYEFDLDESKKVKNLFWTDGRSREWYEKYGDVVSFDTTYFTNRYNLPFAPFVGISGHGNTIVFGCAFLHDETSETFKWLFRTFLKAMSQKEPKTIITDQDGAMRSAIAQVFQNAKHINCFFHIVKKAFNLFGNLFKAKEGLYDEYEDIINNSVTEEEFEYLWQEMIDSFEVQHINFLKHMWSIRKRFIPVYFKGDFCPFIKSTALSEGTNSRFKNNVGPQYSITNFMIEYERVMDTIQNLEQFDDHISRTKKPSKLWSHYYIEYQAMRMYNRKIFIKFQVELKRTTRFQINEVEKFKTYEVFFGIESKYSIMLHLNAMKIPEKYIIERWTKKEYKGLGGKGNGNIPLAQSSILRFNILSRKSAEIASNGSKSNETFQFAVEEMDKIAKQLELMCSNKDAEQEINDSDPNAEDNLNSHEKGNQQSEENTEEILLDPDIAKSKGRPAQRYKTIREEIQQKELYHCSHCQRTDHTFPTCPLKHVEFDLPRKKRRKVKNTREQDGVEQKKKDVSNKRKDLQQDISQEKHNSGAELEGKKKRNSSSSKRGGTKE